ncbi:MAG TPA: MerR family transcriptional regulator [Candidatus Baltobacteraceae bacterium]|nr:MerR family transcriptional regulator [Candidatus Baltobacteraceae bacterium]
MQATAQKLKQARQFAREAGVTVRTLHVYDRLGLLPPAARSDSGYRLYGEAELERLEQILALRFVGFRLEHIKELLAGPKWPLVVALRMQREIIAQQMRKLDAATQAIEQAESTLIADESADRWKVLCNIIEALRMENDYNWTQNYYNDAAREKLEEMRKNTPQEVVEQGQRDWAALIAEVEEAASRNEDPAGEHAQALAGRWRGLVGQFTKGDADVAQGLKNLWSDPTHWPKDFKRPWSDAADAWIKRAMNCG